MTTYETTTKKSGRFIVRIKKKVVAAPPTMTALDKVLEFVGALEDSDISVSYDSIIGRSCPIEGLASMNIVESEALAVGLAGGLQRHFDHTPGPVAVQTRHLAVTPGSAPVVDVAAVRKMAPSNDIDGISAIDLSAVPDPSDSSGFGIAIAVRTIHFGPDVQYGPNPRANNRRSREFPYARGTSRAQAVYMDEVALRDAFGRLLGPRWTVPVAEERDGAHCYPSDWDDGRALRAFILMQILSMLPIEKKLIGAGMGKAILDAELGFAKGRLSAARKGYVSPIHRDGIPHFWFGEAHRLNVVGFSVPLIKLR
jgi:hypothetical protein